MPVKAAERPIPWPVFAAAAPAPVVAAFSSPPAGVASDQLHTLMPRFAPGSREHRFIATLLNKLGCAAAAAPIIGAQTGLTATAQGLVTAQSLVTLAAPRTPGEIAWQAEVAQAPDRSLFALLPSGGVVTTHENGIAARTRDGSEAWRLNLGGTVHAPVVAGDGVIYAYVDLPGSTDRWLVAVSDTGELLWKKEKQGHPRGRILLVDELLVMTTKYGLLTACDRQGNDQWRVLAGSQISQAAVGPDGLVYVVGNGLIAYDQKGNEQWRRPADRFTQGAPLVTSTHAFRVSLNNIKIYSLNGPGKVTYLPAAGGGIIRPPLLAMADGRVAMAFADELRVISSDGKTEWSKPLSASAQPPVQGADGTLYVAAAQGGCGQVYAFTEQGDTVWVSPHFGVTDPHDPQGQPEVSTMVTQDGHVVVSADGRTLVALT